MRKLSVIGLIVGVIIIALGFVLSNMYPNNRWSFILMLTGLLLNILPSLCFYFDQKEEEKK